MAEEETQKEPPALVNYNAGYGIDWLGKDLIKYWSTQLMNYHNTGGRLWSAKEKGIANRMVKEFTGAELERMVVFWMKSTDSSSAYNFMAFYKARKDISRQTQPKDYKWE